VRFVLDLATGTLAARHEIAYDRAPDFPAIDPRLLGLPYDDLWLLGISQRGKRGRKFFDQIARLAWSRPEAADLWQAPAGSYLGGEPVFVPDPALPPPAVGSGAPPQGAVLCQLFDSGRRESSFLVFDAGDLAAGPRARLPLASPIHLGFHAVFAPAR
jgi:carotenoid cleavage dioxygenase-like enzyme